MTPPKTASIDEALQYQRFMQQMGRRLRADDESFDTLDAWKSHKQRLREHLERAWGAFPEQPCPLEPKVVGEFQRDGYRVEKVLLQTRPGIWMTSNAYVPQGDRKRPAVLCVHGHWQGAKQDPVVQSRAIGLAKLGFVVLAVDAFGAGERGIGEKLGEYHGGLVASTLWPAGLALAGLQVYENMRAVDYLQSRPEVDGHRIGITGASGGGNQSMYAGAYDERIGCVVPVCSVGTYQSYLHAASCMCEVIPQALTFTEEWGILAMVAPRALLVINATEDAFQFSPGEARKSVAGAANVFSLYDSGERLRHDVFESKHDYNRAMREAMYDWMTLHLKGDGDGSPIAEPEFETEDPEALRCFPGDSRPDDFVTIPQFAAAACRRILANRPLPEHAEHWDAETLRMLAALTQETLGRFPQRSPLDVQYDESADDTRRKFTFAPEPGIRIAAKWALAEHSRKTAILLHLDGMAVAGDSQLAAELKRAGWNVVTVDLRATGRFAYPRDTIGDAVGHTTPQWAMWCGRPLLGQWVWDVSRLVDALAEIEESRIETLAVAGVGSAAVVTLCSAALDRRIEHAALSGAPISFVSDRPFRAIRIGVLAPGMVRDVGDIPHLAGLIAPRSLIVAGGTTAAGEPISSAKLSEHFAYTQRAFDLEDAPRRLRILGESSPEELVTALGELSGES